MATQIIDYPKISDDQQAQAFYEAMRANGESHNMAKLLALRQAPSSVTDRELFLGHCNGSQFSADTHSGDVYKRKAERAGVSTTGKVYLSSLALEPGDPKAWVNGRGDIKRLCEERNFNCEGIVKHKATVEKRPSVPLAQNIVDEHVNQIIADDPGKATKRKQVEREVRERHTPHWHKKAGRTFETMKKGA